jgi:hypothetical protein
MKLFKILLAMSLGTVSVCPARPTDSQAQALAREALEKKLKELQTSQPPPQTTPMVPVAPGIPATTGIPVTPGTPGTPPAPAMLPQAPESDKILKARQALHQKLGELGAPSMAEIAPPVAPSATAAGMPISHPKPMGPVTRKGVHIAQEFPPLPSPSSPITGDKAQRLAELLRRYQADEITPQQYHAERAKLVGGDQ